MPLLLSVLCLVPTSSVAELLWETQSQGTPRGAPLLAPDDRGYMDVFIPLGGSGLGGWDCHGEPLPGFPVAPSAGVLQRPASVFFPSSGSHFLVFADNSGLVHAIDRYGSEAPGWPVDPGAGVVTGVLSADLNSDGEPEIAFGTTDGFIHLVDPSGRDIEGWPVRLESQLLFQPALLPTTTGAALVCPLSNTWLTALDYSGRTLPGWPVYSGFAAGTVPATADMDSDGSFGVVLATRGRRLLALDSMGEDLPGWPYTLDYRPVIGSLAVGLLDDNAAGTQVCVSTQDGFVYLFDSDGSLAGTWRWPLKPPSQPTAPLIIPAWSGGNAVVVGTEDGEVYGWNAEGELLGGYPILHGDAILLTPAAGDIDGSGTTDIVVAGRSGLVAAYSVAGSLAERGTWPQMLSDEANTASYGIDILPMVRLGTVAGEQSGDVTVQYEFTRGSAASLRVSYSVDAGYSWQETTSFT